VGKTRQAFINFLNYPGKHSLRTLVSGTNEAKVQKNFLPAFCSLKSLLQPAKCWADALSKSRCLQMCTAPQQVGLASSCGPHSQAQKLSLFIFWTLAKFLPPENLGPHLEQGGIISPLTVLLQGMVILLRVTFWSWKKAGTYLHPALTKTSAFNIASWSNHYNLTQKFAVDIHVDISMWSKAFRTVQGNSSHQLPGND
jgi:hypothetical protein